MTTSGTGPTAHPVHAQVAMDAAAAILVLMAKTERAAADEHQRVRRAQDSRIGVNLDTRL